VLAKSIPIVRTIYLTNWSLKANLAEE
jgi:hypothetical protein